MTVGSRPRSAASGSHGQDTAVDEGVERAFDAARQSRSGAGVNAGREACCVLLQPAVQRAALGTGTRAVKRGAHPAPARAASNGLHLGLPRS